MSREVFIAEIPEALRREISDDIGTGSHPQLLIEVGETSVRVSCRPSMNPGVTWGAPLVGVKS